MDQVSHSIVFLDITYCSLGSEAIEFHSRTRAPRHYTNAQCNGSESSLIDCPLQRTNRSGFCGNGSDAGVYCDGA